MIGYITLHWGTWRARLCAPFFNGRFHNGPGYCPSCRALTRDLIDLGHKL